MIAIPTRARRVRGRRSESNRWLFCVVALLGKCIPITEQLVNEGFGHRTTTKLTTLHHAAEFGEAFRVHQAVPRWLLGLADQANSTGS